MLGPTLLQYHNMHHMQRFVAAIRQSIAQGTLDQMLERFRVPKPDSHCAEPLSEQ